MSQAEDVEAIAQYFNRIPPLTRLAADIRDSFVNYYQGTSSITRNYDQSFYDTIRNKKHDYDAANALATQQPDGSARAAAMAAAEEQARRGMSTEEMQGLPDKRLSDGSYAVAPPLLPADLGSDISSKVMQLAFGAMIFYTIFKVMTTSKR